MVGAGAGAGGSSIGTMFPLVNTWLKRPVHCDHVSYVGSRLHKKPTSTKQLQITSETLRKEARKRVFCERGAHVVWRMPGGEGA